jgi:hypothetical protein
MKGAPSFVRYLSFFPAHHSPTIRCSFLSLKPYFLSSFFSCPSALFCSTGITYLLSIQALAHSFHRDGGCTPLSPDPRSNHSTLPFYPRPFFSYSCELFCACQKLNFFVFKQIRTLLQKHRGVGVLLGSARRSSQNTSHCHPGHRQCYHAGRNLKLITYD